MLEIGSVPHFSLSDTDGHEFDLASYVGKESVYVYFMRATTCMQCNAIVQNLARNKESFDAEQVAVVVAVPEELADAAAWKEKRKVPLPVVVGTQGTPHADAGLMRKVFGAIQQSGSILLDRDGILRYQHVSTNPSASYDKAEVAAAIAALPTGAGH